MAIKRLTPTVRDLGFLRLWRDDIAEMAGFAAQIRDAKIVMEADNNELDDVQADLPKIGKRLGYFKLTAARPDEDGQPQVVLKLHLTRGKCQVEADNPDTEIRGIIADVEDAARKHRRIPRSLPHFTSGPIPTGQFWSSMLYVLGISAAVILALIAPTSIAAHASHKTANETIPWPWSVFAVVAGATLIVGIITTEVLSRTILATASRSEAPTSWQEYRGHIAIAVIFGLVFFFLGALVHL